MKPQMIRVISSPSSSTTGVFTLIFAIAVLVVRVIGRHRDRGRMMLAADIRTAGRAGQSRRMLQRSVTLTPGHVRCIPSRTVPVRQDYSYLQF